MTTHVHTLAGCAPVPLANYLKALGILRLVGEQADRSARGWWEGERFRLMTTLSEADLERFFLEQYEPTPLISPWNRGSGFYKENDPGLTPLVNSTAPRLEMFRAGIRDGRMLLDTIENADKVVRAIKDRTKTTKAFQSEEQRQRLAGSAVYREHKEKLQQQIERPDLSEEKRRELQDELGVIESLTAVTDRPPRSQEANTLKESAGYKRLLAAAERRFMSAKARLIPDCRQTWRGLHARWMSVAVVLDDDANAKWPSLVGTGGADGRLDFTNNFMQLLGTLFDLASESAGPKPATGGLLRHALWDTPSNALISTAIGQYQPGNAGGANGSTGFSGGNSVNPWDFVFALEGTLLFTALATRQLDPQASSRASAPFAVRPHAAGFATPGNEKAQRGEQWMPLWGRPATLAEVTAVYGEARVQLRRQTVNQPIDLARAINRWGVARGIDAFVRYGYLERNGQSTLAVPLGTVPVRQNRRSFLTDDLAGWHERLQRRSRDSHAPARLIVAERRLSDAIFAVLTEGPSSSASSASGGGGQAARWQAVLRAAAAVEAIQVGGTAFEAGPIPSLRPEWITAADDGTPEFRLAVALGSAAAPYVKNERRDSVRGHVLPLDPKSGRFRTSENRLINDPRVVVSGRDPIRDLIAIVERRLVESAQRGERRSRLEAAPGCGANLNDIAAFLTGTLDLEKLFDLARALMAIRWAGSRRPFRLRRGSTARVDDVPEAWLAIRLACRPEGLGDALTILADPRLVRHLATGDSVRAIDGAVRRLQAAGIRPPLRTGVTDPGTARLWAAALAFPLDRQALAEAVSILDPSLEGAFHG